MLFSISVGAALYLAARRTRLDSLAPEGNSALSALCTSSSWLRLHTRLDLTGHGKERLFNIGRRLGRSLEEFNAKRVSKLLSLFRRNDTLGRQIGLVTNQQLVHILTGVSVDFMQPLFDIIEGLIVRDIVNHDNTMGTTVVGRCDGTETLLSGGIPNLKLDGLSVKLNGTDFLHNEERVSANSEKQERKRTFTGMYARLTKSTPIVEM